MDAVSTIISILELCSEIRDYISEVEKAPEAMTEYRDRIDFCQFLLRKLEVSPENADRRKKWEETLELLKKPGAPLHTLKDSLDLVKKKLGAGSYTQSGLRKAIHTLKWPFDKRQVEELIKAINSDIALLEVAVSLDQRSLLMDIERSQKERGETLAKMMEHLQHELQTVQTAEHRKTVLNWISKTDYGKKQSDLYNLRQPQTGEWLLNSSEFIEWKDSEKRSRTLFCPGMPGAGKTILTSVVVRTLTDRFTDDPSVAIAWLYCDFRLKQEQTLDNLLASLVKQLLLDHTPLPSVVEELYKRNGPRNTRPSTEEFVEVLETVVSCRRRVFVLADGLDECGDERAMLLEVLFGLQNKHHINLFATSRDIPDIMDRFTGLPKVEIRASDQDIQAYLDGYFRAHIGEMPSFVRKNPVLQQDIKDAILTTADGMFLLAYLYIISIKDMIMPRVLKAALEDYRRQGTQLTDDNKKPRRDHKNGPLAEAYEKAMRSIEDQQPCRKALAIQALSWITCAKWPLSKRELQHALMFSDSIQYDDGESLSELLEDEYLLDIDDVVSACVGLVRIDEQSQIVRLVHYTTQEYFERTQSRWFPNASDVMARACIRYLSLGNLNHPRLQPDCDEWVLEYELIDRGLKGTVPDRSRKMWDLLLESRPLYRYASKNWHVHADSISAITEEVINLLQRDEKMIDLHMWDVGFNESGLYQFLEEGKSVTALHLVSSSMVSEVMMKVAERVESLDTPDTFGRTPLMYAMSFSKLECPGDIEAMVRALLATKMIDITLKDQKDWTALSYAAYYQDEGVLKLILEAYLLEDNGALCLDSKDWNGQTPLSLAARMGNEAAVRLLLESNQVDPESKDNRGRNPLSHAAATRYYGVVQLLLASGRVNANSKDNEGKTPLSYAASRGNYGGVQLLLASGQVNADSKDNKGKTPLSHAAARGYDDAVKLLLASGQVNADSKDNEGKTPLSHAAATGHHGVVQLLLASGRVNADSKDNEGKTPLLHAITKFYQDSELIAKTLTETGQVDLDSKTNDQWTPLLYAARNGLRHTLQLLLASSQVDINHKNNHGRTPLFYANYIARQRFFEENFDDDWITENPETCHPIIQLLLNANGVDVNARDNLGYTPLSSAVVADASDFISLLLEDQRVNVNSANDFGETPLMKGIEHGASISNLKLLLGHPRLDLDLEDQKGRTALSIAIEKNNQEAIRLLREKCAEMGKQLPETEPAVAEGQAEAKA